VDFAAIEALPSGNLDHLQLLDDAVSALISPDSLRREFLGRKRLVTTLHGAVTPDPAALEFAGWVACLASIADAICVKLNPHPTEKNFCIPTYYAVTAAPRRA
jgi:type I restriction enzyme R subunit